MRDVFKEQIVKRKPTAIDFLKRIVLIFGVIAVFVVSSSIVPPHMMTIPLLLTFGAGFGAWYLMSFINLEYEYVITSGDLDIDVIYNRSRRKRIFSMRVSDIELMIPISDNTRIGEINDGVQKTRDFSSGVTTENTYVFVTNHHGQRTKVIMEPNEMMLKAFSASLSPRKLHRK